MKRFQHSRVALPGGALTLTMMILLTTGPAGLAVDPSMEHCPATDGAVLTSRSIPVLIEAQTGRSLFRPGRLQVAIIDQFYPGDDSFDDAEERQRQLMLSDAVDIDGDFRPDPYYHGDLVRLFVEAEGVQALPYPVHDLEEPKRDILAQLEQLRRQVDAGAPIDAVLLCWESSTPIHALDDQLRVSELPRYRQTIREWGDVNESWRLTDAIITAMEALTARGMTVVTIAGNAGSGWINTYGLAQGVITVGGAEPDTEGRWNGLNDLVGAVARSAYHVRLVCDPDRPAFGYDIDDDGQAEIPLSLTSGFHRDGSLPRDSWRVLKGSSFAAPTAIRELALAGILRPH